MTKVVEVPTPVVVKPDAALVADCPPEYTVPATGPVTVNNLTDEVAADRAALAVCRDRLSKLR